MNDDEIENIWAVLQQRPKTGRWFVIGTAAGEQLAMAKTMTESHRVVEVEVMPVGVRESMLSAWAAASERADKAEARVRELEASIPHERNSAMATLVDLVRVRCRQAVPEWAPELREVLRRLDRPSDAQQCTPSNHCDPCGAGLDCARASMPLPTDSQVKP